MTASKQIVPPLPAVLDEVATALERLSDALNGGNDLRTGVQQVCEQVVGAVPGLDDASITLLNDGRPFTAATTSVLVAELDAVQYSTDAGPYLDAATTRSLVRATIDEAQHRWPAFGTASRAAGMVSFLSAPLTVDSSHSGAINGYSRTGNGFLELDAPLLALYTRAVETTLRSHTKYLQATEQAEQLRVALASRAVIDQAKGVLMAVHGMTAEQAFQLLVTQSQRENVKLRKLAERFIADVVSRSPESAPARGQLA